MTTIARWLERAGILRNDNSKGPWGGRGGGSGGDGDGNGGGNGGGPRNPWAFPPEGRRPRNGPSSTLDEFLKRARGGGGGNGGRGPMIPGAPGGRALWLLGGGALLAVWIIFTSFHFIAPQQKGVVTYLGRYGGTLDSGVRFTFPAPFAAVEIVDVQQIRTEDFPSGTGPNLMLTADQNIVDLAYSVRWDIRSAQDFVFQLKAPKETVRATAESAMRAAVASASLNDAIGSGRTVIEAEVRTRMQEILDEYRSGIRVQGVAIKQASPPQQVDEAFKRVTAAQQQAQADRNNANAYAQQVIARAQGEAAEFDKIYEQYRLSPEVTRRRMYYETMEEVLGKSNKTIVEAPGVVPYLPLPEVRRGAAQPQPQAQAQQGAQQ